MPTSSRTPAHRPTWPSDFALLNVGDTVMGMDLSQGGRLTDGSPVNMSGKNYNFVLLRASPPRNHGRIDYAALAKQVAKVRPKLLVAGAWAQRLRHRL